MATLESFLKENGIEKCICKKEDLNKELLYTNTNNRIRFLLDNGQDVIRITCGDDKAWLVMPLELCNEVHSYEWWDVIEAFDWYAKERNYVG